MSAIFQIESSDHREQPFSLAGMMLTEQLAKYQQLRREEKKLRGRVEFIYRQIALRGPLHVEVDLAMLLQKEKEKLGELREEIDQQEERLKKAESLPLEKRTAIDAEELEQLLGDLKAKREQARIYQGNLNFLQEKEAQFGINTRVDLANELILTQTELEKVRAELNQLEKKLQTMWQIQPDAIPDFDQMNEKQIEKFANEFIAQRDAAERAQTGNRKKAFAEKYDDMVKTALSELKGTLSSGSNYHVNSEFDTTGEVAWKLSAVGSFAGARVELILDRDNSPIYFKCIRLNHDNKIANELQAALTSESLMATLKALYQEEKSWWKFWSK